MKTKTYKIYIITNLVNNKKYVGQTISNINQRWNSHCHKDKRLKWQSLIHKAIEKYGRASFTIEVVQECNSMDELNNAEIEWITKIKSQIPNGYNILSGGKNRVSSEKFKEKMRQIQRNRSPEWQKNLREGLKKRGKEWRKKISLAHIGKKATTAQMKGLKIGWENARKYTSEETRGENNVKCKIDANKVREIRNDYSTGQFTQQQIANKFNLSQGMIGHIVRRRNWKHIE